MRYGKVALIAFIITLFCCPLAQGDVKLRMMVVNPSDVEAKAVPVKTYLPKGIKPEDITDKGKFEIDYDFERSLYYAYQEVALAPGETVVLEIAMKDIWVISTEEVTALKNYTSKIISALQKTEYYYQAKTLSDSINERLDRIIGKQKTGETDIEQRLFDYEANATLLREVKKDISILEDLAIEKGALEGKQMLGENPDEAASVRAEDTALDLEKLGTVKFKIEASNPSAEKTTMSLKYYFPIEVKPGYIVNSGGLEVGYDYQKGIHYVYKDAIDLAPKENKEYIVEVKDVWVIPEERIKVLREHVVSLIDILAESEYKETAGALGNKIKSDLDGILTAQKNPTASVEEHIGEYRAVLARFNETKKDVARLEKLVIQAGGSPGLTMSGKKLKIQGSGVKGKGSGGKGEGELARGAKGMELVGKTMFRGKAPNIGTTWRIIYAIIGFLGISSLLFIMIQFQQQHRVMFDALTGTFRREYIVDKLKEEIIITQRVNSKCSLLLADIDKFKSINDTYGHAVGDIVIKEFIVALRQGIRNSDFVGRLGGDEFLVILSYVDKERAQLIADKIRKLVAEHTIRLKNKVLNMTASIGVTTYPDDARVFKELLDKADKAMYKAKASGGNSVAV